MEQALLRKYAQLIARVGGNVQPGQEVFITAEVDQPDFVALLVQACYDCQAKKVVVEWGKQSILKLHYRYCSVETLGTVDDYEEMRWKHFADVAPCHITLLSEDPSGLNGIDHEKFSKSEQMKWPVFKPYRDAMENRYQWCFACVPGPDWAHSLFPDLPVEAAMEKLWGLLLTVCRVEEDPVAAWEAHNRDLLARSAYLNALPLRELHFTSANGTDFRIGMIPQARFNGVLASTDGGVSFTPNLPTEECLITPRRGEAEGIVYGTKPLCFHGQMAENFWIRFHQGKAVEWHAEKNQELLDQLIGIDGDSAYLGECALVPFDSPISKSGVLFYNTLIDENAACHLALGKGYINSIEHYQTLTLDECHAMGVNESQIHEDFMIGSADMAVDAICTDGRIVPIFRDGTWAF